MEVILVNQVIFGEHFKVLEIRKKWSKIRLAHDSYEGWICNKQWIEIEEDIYKQLDKEVATITTDILDIITKTHHQPIVIGSILPSYKSGHALINNEMYQFDGLTTPGFIKKDKLVENALMYLNAPYLWGGRSQLGIDCSGFTQMVCRLQGVDLPRDKKVAYSNMVCNHRPLKKEQDRVRLTLGGDVLDYLGDTASPAALLIESKLLFNSVISDSHLGARFMSLDIKDFFLQSILHDAEYLRIHSKYFLPDIRTKYNIDNLISTDGYVYCKIKRDMYGLKQAARLTRDQLINNLAPFDYFLSAQAPNIWIHSSKRTIFFVC